MNCNDKLWFKIFYQWQKKSVSGFTLLELLIVMIIVGILAAISIPNFINQVGKTRESETKSYLGLIARGQQGYHWEKRTFAPQLELLGVGSVGGTQSKYHNIPDPSDVSDVRVKHQAFALDAQKDQVRNFAIGIYYDTGQYTIALCQSVDVGGTVNVGDNATDSCTNGGIKLK
ncbi:type IV pilin-like G/H family protein [Cyanobacterium aponinum UTEX 3221]|uniref:type IV pilin-like G/H family protein n=1 Tax=Cyanobacterium aponinum TaxID=379064 RepID=UPI002B4BBF03|nr:type IV pilin-like G/H family protein [Cyanobacterium aponinum]WRL37724.1 type IV pilin-like G/H family protein [Cyanobacterium aponinum UTEX 3221]